MPYDRVYRIIIIRPQYVDFKALYINNGLPEKSDSLYQHITTEYSDVYKTHSIYQFSNI